MLALSLKAARRGSVAHARDSNPAPRPERGRVGPCRTRPQQLRPRSCSCPMTAGKRRTRARQSRCSHVPPPPVSAGTCCKRRWPGSCSCPTPRTGRAQGGTARRMRSQFPPPGAVRQARPRGPTSPLRRRHRPGRPPATLLFLLLAAHAPATARATATDEPTGKPSRIPSTQPSGQPSSAPSTMPSSLPSTQPSRQPSSAPSAMPSSMPSTQPSRQPSSHPSLMPSSIPSKQPSRQPSSIPSRQPSRQPSTAPSLAPSAIPSAQPSRQHVGSALSVYVARKWWRAGRCVRKRPYIFETYSIQLHAYRILTSVLNRCFYFALFERRGTS